MPACCLLRVPVVIVGAGPAGVTATILLAQYGVSFVGLRETPSENAMEAGLIFPAPGQEEAWFKANHERLTELGLN